ncbi:MAG: SGNH/GDSL hydrolase family protein [Verrucomicrobiales bacterium]|nr:SGNH/GDSL hydrolase family protein [Verrucomicrobiales bacterium]
MKKLLTILLLLANAAPLTIHAAAPAAPAPSKAAASAKAKPNAKGKAKGKAAARTPQAAEPARTKGLQLQDGDRFLFIGDSITHQCLYTQFVEDFFYTRYPNIRLHFRNAGVSGDRAVDALDRFEPDIAAFKPTVATILLGMNDGRYQDFSPEIFQTYAADMTKLLDRLDAIQCRVILMSPTMFDHEAFDSMIAANPDRARGKTPTNYNAVLAYMGKWGQEVARQRGYLFVDLFGPLNTDTTQERRRDPEFTLIPDAIHPGADGQLVMAYSLLKQTGELASILRAGVGRDGDEWKSLSPKTTTDVRRSGDNAVSYKVTPTCLPWAIFEAAPVGARITRAGHTGSQESHVAQGLNPGKYELLINGQAVHTFTDRQLAVHGEIEADPDSPTYQQAMRVIELNRKRNDEAVRPLRDLYGQRKGRLRTAREKGDEGMAAFAEWEKTEFTPKAAQLTQRAAELETEIYQINQPSPLEVTIRPAASTGKP